jgi:hypothetical protein
MTHAHLWRRIACGATLAVLAAACNETTAPKLIDPAGTAAAVSAADSALSSPVFTSFSTIGAKLTPVASAMLGPASLYSATKPDLAGRQPFALTVERATLLQSLVPQLSILNAAGIPKIDSIAGAVFQWDATNHRYYKAATTGCTSGNGPCIRFILYAIDPLTDEPATSLTQVGTADFIDRSTGSTTSLQILVLGSGGAPTYVDYTVAVTPGTNSFTASATGTLSNGLAGGANKTLTFTATFTASPGSVTADATFALNNPAVTVTLNESLVSGQDTVLTLHFGFTRPGESITLDGSVRVHLGVATINVTIKVGGVTFATITGPLSNPTITQPNGQTPTADELAVLGKLFGAAESFSSHLGGLFDPVRSMF